MKWAVGFPCRLRVSWMMPFEKETGTIGKFGEELEIVRKGMLPCNDKGAKTQEDKKAIQVSV